MSKKSSLSNSSDPLRLIGRASSIASFGLFVILAANCVDARIKNAQEIRIQEDLVAETSLQQIQLEQFKTEASKWDHDIELLNERAVTEEEIAGIQNELIELAKKNSCTLKKVTQRGVLVRPLIEKNQNKPGEAREENSGLPSVQKELEVHEAGLTLSSEGDFQNTLRLLEAIKNSNWITSTHQLVLRRDPAQASMLIMDLEITFLSLKIKSDKNL